MNKEMIKKVDEKILSEKILFSCLANIEPRISKAAYLKKKFQYSGIASNECHEYEMKMYMGYRSLITDLLVRKYTKQTIKGIVINIDKSDIVTNKLCDTVVELIKSNDYKLE